MSGLLAGRVWQSNLGSHLKPLAAAMADIANDDGSSIYPSVGYLAWLLGKGERSVQYGLEELRTLGVISAVAYDQGGRGHTTEYRLHEAELPKRPPWRANRKGATSAPFTSRKGATPTLPKDATLNAKGCNPKQQRVKPTAPDQSVEPPLDPSVDPSIPSPNNGDGPSRKPKEVSTEDFTIWKLGIKKLVAVGSTESAARSFMGELVRLYGRPAVARAITEALAQEAVEPKAYIIAVLRKQNALRPGVSKVDRSINSVNGILEELEAQKCAQSPR